MSPLPHRIRGGAAARLTRYDLDEASGLGTATLDRLALTLGFAALTRDRSGRAPADEDTSGDSHDLAVLRELGGADLVAAVCQALSLPDDLSTALTIALNRGYAELQARVGRRGRGWPAALAELLREVGGSQGRTTGPATLLTVEVGVRRDDAAPVTWRVNDESGLANNANTRIAGASGKGKTQFLEGILAEIAAQSPQTGIFLLDYKGDISENASFVQSIGATVVDLPDTKLPINPFEVPEGTPPRLAARSFAELFASMSPQIGPVQRLLLTRAMQGCFERAASVDESPGLAQIRAAVLRHYREEGRPEDSVTSTLADVAELGLFAERTLPQRRLLEGRWIVRLDKLPGLRKLVAFVLVEYLHNTIGTLPDADFDAGCSARTLRTIVAIDEAHYYLKGRAEALYNLIRIGRSKGTPVFLSSQSLDDYRAETELEELFANTFVFGHGQPPSKKVMAGALGLPAAAGRAAADRVTGLAQFELLTQLASSPATGAAIVRCHPFFERSTTRGAAT